MDNVPHVVVAIDVGVPQDAVEVLVDGFDDDVRVTGKNGNERAFGEQDSHLGTGREHPWVITIANVLPGEGRLKELGCAAQRGDLITMD